MANNRVMRFDAGAYGPEVAAILALDGNGERLMPLGRGVCSSVEARHPGKARAEPGSEVEKRAMAVQRMEWQLLFAYCAACAS